MERTTNSATGGSQRKNAFLDLVPWPSTLCWLGDFEAIGRKYTNDELPAYEPMEAPLPRRPEIPNIGDPFPAGFCYVHNFQEKGMPSFDVPFGGPCEFKTSIMTYKFAGNLENAKAGAAGASSAPASQIAASSQSGTLSAEKSIIESEAEGSASSS